jgi:ABC-2 type transport system ATP-binding protein
MRTLHPVDSLSRRARSDKLVSGGARRVLLRSRVIRLRGLTKRYGDVEAVAGIDLDVPGGALTGLLGPNGAGKSTTLRMLTGMLPPTSGSIEVHGIDVVRDPIAVKRITGYVPESGAVFETLTGREYLTLVAELYRLPVAAATTRAHQLAELFQLDERLLEREQMAAYSKGTRQKVVIVSALLHRPKVVLFDEPLNGLDANATLAFKTLVTALAREGATILYCSHLLDIVERVCERVIVLARGRIVADGSAATLQAKTGEATLEAAFTRLTAAEDLAARAQALARALTE